MTTRIKVGPYQYAITFTDTRAIDGFDSSKWGDVRHDLLRMRIHENIAMQVQLTTLMHEVLHAMEFISGSDFPEAVPTELAPQIIQFLEDNGVNLNPLRKILREAA
jgi:hypothetical protein